MKHAALADQLQKQLDLDYPPVGLARASARPANVPELADAVPSACTFWRRAERQTFFVGADAHMGCPIGAMVMGFELNESKQAELMGLVGDMCAVAYLREDEVGHIPHFDDTGLGVVYGPLAEMPLDPEVVLVWATPKQAMLIEEMLGATAWVGSGAAVLGRPACAALPSAFARSSATLSLGCIGMRTFTEIPETHALVAIPNAALDTLTDRLGTTIAANAHMESKYRAMKSAV